MKKITLLMAVLTFAAFAMAVPIGMSGTYKVGTAETSPNYATLKAAIDAIKTAGVSGDIVLEISSDLTEAANIGFGVNTNGFSITIRPDADVDRTITFTQTTDNTASSGAIVIGLSDVSSWASLVITNNITINGFAVGGTTQRLTLATASTAHANSTPIHMIGDVNNITIKNCKFTVNQTTGTASFGAISMRVGNWSTVDCLPDNITIDNCLINSSTPSGAGIFISNTTSNSGAVPTGRPTGLVFKNNVISVKHRAISLNYSGTSSVYNNELRVNQTTSGMASFAIGGTSSGLVTTNVYNNKIIQLGTANTAGAGNGIRGIQASGGGTWNIYNNYITGFSTPATGTTEALGIRTGSASNVYNNTILLNNLTTTGAGTSPTACIVNYATACTLANNLLITQEDDFASYCIYQAGTLTTSDYNTLYRSGTVNAKIGYATSARATLADWQTGSTKDANSKSIAVNFTDAATGNLSLTGASVGNYNLAVPRQATVLTDITGTTNRASLTYAGAYEASDLTTIAKQFTATVPAGTPKVYIAGTFTGKAWDITTPFELLPTGTANQFSGIFPCVDGVTYKYYCEKVNDWDYEEGRYNTTSGAAPLKLAADRTYNAADNVVLWYRMNKITLNASFVSSAVPSKLFVKGSFNAWATGIELTKTGNTFSTVLGGNVGDKYPANTEYKYYTNDEVADNWESTAIGGNRDNRWSISPVMNDAVDRFTTWITTKVEEVETTSRIARTSSGIEVTLESEGTIEIYNMSGMLIDKTKTIGTYTHDLNNGIYIVRINGKATKFIK